MALCMLLLLLFYLSRLYKGLTPTTLKQGSNHSIRFSAMETLSKWYTGGD
jgi:hypothetical protein